MNKQKVFFSDHNSTDLIEHSVAVHNIGYWILKNKCNIGNGSFICDDDKNIIRDVRIACALHDIGKVDNEFQKFIISEIKKGDKIEKKSDYIKHNVYSWAFLYDFICSVNNHKYNEKYTTSVLYHHPLYEDVDEISLDDVLENIKKRDILNDMYDVAINILKQCNLDINVKNINSESKSSSPLNKLLFTNADDFNDGLNLEAVSIIVRNILISSDRIVSSLNPTEFKKIYNNDEEYISELLNKMLDINYLKSYSCLENDVEYKDRLVNQKELLNKTNTDNNVTHIIGACAGYGKTLLGIMKIIDEGRKGLWVCPRNIIAESVYESIVKEVEKIGYGEHVDDCVGLLLGGEYKYGHENSDIIVTNIDNFLNPIIKNKVSHTLIRMLTSTVIFDEYHELFTGNAYFSVFLKILFGRNNYIRSKSLLLSATPLAYKNNGEYIPHIQKAINNIKCYYEPSHLSDIKYIINSVKEIDNINEIVVDNDRTCVVVNTITNSQQIYLKYKNKFNGLYHTKFQLFDENGDNFQDNKRLKLGEYFGKESLNTDIKSICGTRMIGTGLDISFDNMIETILSPEATLQTIGRINRWGRVTGDVKIDLFLINNKSEEKIIDIIYNNILSKLWFDYLKKYEGKALSLSEIYDIYYEFHTEYKKYTKNNKIGVEDWFMKLYRNSVRCATKLSPYKSKTPKNKKNSNIVLRTNLNSFRSSDGQHYAVVYTKGLDLNTAHRIIINDRDLDYQRKSLPCGHKFTIDFYIENTDILNNKKLDGKKVKNIRNFNDDDMKKLGFGNTYDKPFILTDFYYDSEIGLVANDSSFQNDDN